MNDFLSTKLVYQFSGLNEWKKQKLSLDKTLFVLQPQDKRVMGFISNNHLVGFSNE